MYKIFCCRSRQARNVEEDKITDSLEMCLSCERGVTEFRNFLVSKRLEVDTLQVFLKCNSILREINNLSQGSRNGQLPGVIQDDIDSLYNLSQDINLDANQRDRLKNLHARDINTRIRAIEDLREASEDLMQDTYKSFRRAYLNKIL